MTGPCAKTVVRCTLIATDGQRFVGENECRNPQPVCPREPGEGYEKCETICDQVGHAEIVALRKAGPIRALDAQAYIEGHDHACGNCRTALSSAGVASITIGSPWPVETASTKLTNPKDAIGSAKLPLHLVPATLKVYACLAFAEGAVKYGAYNWRAAGVRTSIYKSALERHLEKWWNGEDVDPETGVPHLANLIACAGIFLDAQLCGKLNDDRPPAAPVARAINEAEALVRSLQALHADKNPKHWTISDELPS